MECKYSVRRLRTHIEVSCTGSLTRHCILDLADTLDDEGLDALCDYTGITDVKLTPAEMDNASHLLFGLYLRREGCKRIAFVAPEGPVQEYVQSLRQMLETLHSVRVTICDTHGDALRFLSDPFLRSDKATRSV